MNGRLWLVVLMTSLSTVVCATAGEANQPRRGGQPPA